LRGPGKPATTAGPQIREHSTARAPTVPLLSPNYSRRGPTPVSSRCLGLSASPCLSAIGRQVATMVCMESSLRIPLVTPDAPGSHAPGRLNVQEGPVRPLLDIGGGAIWTAYPSDHQAAMPVLRAIAVIT